MATNQQQQPYCVGYRFLGYGYVSANNPSEVPEKKKVEKPKISDLQYVEEEPEVKLDF